MTIRKIREDEVTFDIHITPEDFGPEDHFASDEPEADKKLCEEIHARLRHDDLWAWCCVEVRATLNLPDGTSITGSEYLGACSYKDEREFKAKGGYYKQMREEALADLQREIEAEVTRGAKLAEFFKEELPSVFPLAEEWPMAKHILNTELGAFSLIIDSETRARVELVRTDGHMGDAIISGRKYWIRAGVQLHDGQWVVNRTEMGNESAASLDVIDRDTHHGIQAGKKVRDIARKIVLDAINAFMGENPQLLADAKRRRIKFAIDNSTRRIDALKKEIVGLELANETLRKQLEE